MEFWKPILKFICTPMQRPEPYGWYHLSWVGLMIAAAVLLCVTHKKGDDKRVRRTVLISSIIMFVMELYIQTIYSFNFNELDEVVFNYQWYAFPCQFCSIPMYVGLLASVVRKGRVHDALCSFLGTYAIFGGLTVMVYPPQVFVERVGINVQTMLCHGMMIVVGVYLLYTQYVKLEHKTILKAMSVFVCLMLCAMLMNEIAYWSGLLETHVFNMFYISPHCEPTLPVYSLIQKAVPYPVALLVYFVGFSLIAYIILLVAIGINKLNRRMSKK